MNGPKRQPTAGRLGTGTRVGHEWTGWKQPVCHPQAPAGAGGPGHFAARKPLQLNAESDLRSPWQPGPTGAEPLDTPAAQPKPPNPPPETQALSLGVIKEVKADFVDYQIKAEILDDKSGGVTAGALTDFTQPASKAPKYDSVDGKITKFKGKFTFKGTIQIQTKYAKNADASGLSCYGRGTTDTDVENRDITLGFHESCHRNDYQNYLKVHSLPDPPTMSIGMTAADYDKEAAAFVDALNQYWTDMKADSHQKTDEVGFTIGEMNRTNSCYEHLLP
jgi:hypothetical protein